MCLIKKEGVRPANINIMSQYKAQCSKIKERLKKHHVQNVNTVAGSQGNVDFYAPPLFKEDRANCFAALCPSVDWSVHRQFPFLLLAKVWVKLSNF